MTGGGRRVGRRLKVGGGAAASWRREEGGGRGARRFTEQDGGATTAREVSRWREWRGRVSNGRWYIGDKADVAAAQVSGLPQ